MKKTNFQHYLDGISPEAKKTLAARLDTSVVYLTNLQRGYMRSNKKSCASPGAKILARIEVATDGEIKPNDCVVGMGKAKRIDR